MIKFSCWFVLSCIALTNKAEECPQSNGYFFCPISDRCIPKQLRCDSTTDCVFGEDERGCSGCITFCDRNSVCILRRELCDGFPHCQDGTDEANCNETISCSHGQFNCLVKNNSICLDNLLLCDGTKDCDDNFDEQNCASATTTSRSIPNECEGENPPSFCPPGPLKASNECPFSSDFLYVNSKIAKCDSFDDCLLGEDERNCESKTCLEFQCSSKDECIRNEQVCDGKAQCSDQSDEWLSSCNVKFENSTPDTYKCDIKCRSTSANHNIPFSSFCIGLDKICDGNIDCPLGDDEDRSEHGCPSTDGTLLFALCRIFICIWFNLWKEMRGMITKSSAGYDGNLFLFMIVCL